MEQAVEEIKSKEGFGNTGRNEAYDSGRPEGKKHIKIGRHGAEMIMTSDPENEMRMLSQIGIPEGMGTPATLEERIKLVQRLISRSMGIVLPDEEVPQKIGFDIKTDSQRSILFSVLRMMSDTDYRGTYQVPNSQVLEHQFSEGNSATILKAETEGYQVLSQTHIGGSYQNIPSTPVIRITDRDLMIASGFDPDSHYDRDNFRKAKGDLCRTNNFLMYTRFARDEKGRIKKDRNKRTEFELVSTFSPVLNIKVISDPVSKAILYNEISLPSVFLDEVSREYGGVNGGYFLLIPYDCTEEITKAYRKKYPYRKGFIPSAVQALCWWFRLKVQERQNQQRNPLPFAKRGIDTALRISYLDLGRQLDYGEEYLKHKRKKVSKILEDGISIAQELGYITESSYDLLTDEYIFELDLDYYPDRYKKEANPETQAEELEKPS